MIVRVVALLAVLFAAALPAHGQPADRPRPISAPYTHDASGLVLPAKIGPFAIGWVEELRGPDNGDGVRFSFRGPVKVGISLDIYTRGSTVPTGAQSPLVQDEAARLEKIDSVVLQNGLLFESTLIGKRGECDLGGTKFFCLRQQHRPTANNPALGFSTMMALRGQRGHFLRARIAWAAGDGNAEEAALAFFKAWGEELARQP